MLLEPENMQISRLGLGSGFFELRQKSNTEEICSVKDLQFLLAFHNDFFSRYHVALCWQIVNSLPRFKGIRCNLLPNLVIYLLEAVTQAYCLFHPGAHMQTTW